jgi:hypothetical protein
MSKGSPQHIRLSPKNYEIVRTIAYMRNATISATINHIVEEYASKGLRESENTAMWSILNEKTKTLREDK